MSFDQWHKLIPQLKSYSRICLPYGLNILEAARWFDYTKISLDERRFELVVGEDWISWKGSNLIELYSEIQLKCLGYSLADTLVMDQDNEIVVMFDEQQRFTAFAAEERILDVLYPFSREILWENYSLLQEEDGNIPLKEIFDTVYSRSR